MATSPVGSSGSSTNLAQSIAGNQQLGQQDFLKLLVTQLTNQDPLSPQDDKEFIAQMAQFSSLQGVNDMSGTLNKLQASALVGRTVDAMVVANGKQSLVSGVVKSVSFGSGGVSLLVNDQSIAIGQVTQVKS